MIATFKKLMPERRTYLQ